jgi:hypothetical protein
MTTEILFRLKSFSEIPHYVVNNSHFVKLNSLIENNFTQFQTIFNMKNNEVEKKLEECGYALIFFQRFSSFEPSNVNERKILLFLATLY